MPNKVYVTSDTAKTFTSSGGDAAINMASLANNAARMGASVDLGASHAKRYRCEVQVDFGSAPTKGTTVDYYGVTSDDNSNWDGGTAPTDSALGSVDTLPQLQYLGSIVLDDITTPNQRSSFDCEITARYIAPVAHNNGTGQSFTATGTDQIIKLIPKPDEIQ